MSESTLGLASVRMCHHAASGATKCGKRGSTAFLLSMMGEYLSSMPSRSLVTNSRPFLYRRRP